MIEPIHVISLGAGVQSSTMALMAAHGEILPMPDYAIFADTQAEPQSVYLWLDWLEQQLPFPVLRRTRGDLTVDAVQVRQSKRTGQTYLKPQLPVFVMRSNGERGMLFRHCTADYKLDVIRRHIGRTKAMVWIGISTDEAHRMKPSNRNKIENRWPLIECGLSRRDCLAWMEDKQYPKPPRSACYFCPYHNDVEWIRLKTEEPNEFLKAVEFERNLQNSMRDIPRMDGVPFLHDSCVPLDQVEFRHERQGNLFGNECEGMCGV